MASPASPSSHSATSHSALSSTHSPSPSMLSTSAHSAHTSSTSPAASPAAQLHPQSTASANHKPSDPALSAQSASAPPAEKEDVIVCKWSGCTRTFANADILYVHLCDDHVGRKSTNNLCLTCHWDDCDTTCAKRDHITSHLRVHIPLKPHLCHICSKSFKRPQDLKKHERIHPPQIGHANFGTIGGHMPYGHPVHPHQVPHPAMIPQHYPGAGHYPGMQAPHMGGPYPASSFYPAGAPPPPGHQYYSNAQAPTYSNMYADHPGQSLYDNSTYAGLSGASANRKRNHDQIAAVEDFFGQVANKRIAPTYDGAMINRLNDTLANFLEQQESANGGQQAGGYPVSQFVGLPSNSADTSSQGSNSASLAAALHPNAQAHQAQLQAAVAGAAPASNPADLADFNAWLVQLGTDIARGGQRQLSQPNLNQAHQASAHSQHARAHSHGTADPPSSTFDFVASLTQANLTQIPGVDASLLASTFTPASADDSVGSLSVGGHSPAPLSTSSSSSHHGLSSNAGVGSNESPFSFDALVPNRHIAQLPHRALHGGDADKFNTSFNSLAQPRSVPAGARSASGAMHVGSAATIPQLAPHFSTSLGNHGYPVSSTAASEGMFGGAGFPPTAYRRVEPLMRAAPQPGEVLVPSSAEHALRSKSNDEEDSRSTSSASSSSGSHRARSSSPSRSRSVTPSSSGIAAQSSPVSLPSLYPRTLTASEMAKRTLPPPNSSSQYGPHTAKLPSIRAILADRDSDEETDARPVSSSAALTDSLRAATLSPAADAETRAAHLRLIIELLKALNQNQSRRHGELRGSAEEAFSPESSAGTVEDEDIDCDDDDDEDDERPLAYTSSSHGRQRTAEEESAAAVLDGLRLARPSSAAADRGMELDGQRTPLARSPSPSRAAAVSSSPVSAPAPRRVQGLKDLLNDVGVEPMKSRKRQTQPAERMDLD